MQSGSGKTVFMVFMIFSISIFFFGASEVKMKDKQRILLDFEKPEESNNWFVINDVVMGGVSASSFHVSKTGTAVFWVLSHWKTTVVLPQQT